MLIDNKHHDKTECQSEATGDAVPNSVDGLKSSRYHSYQDFCFYSTFSFFWRTRY